ncbi:DUF6153 family protein [Streptomyces oceani]|nr:DUF6153 family protein [Streptomyces oceani]
MRRTARLDPPRQMPLGTLGVLVLTLLTGLVAMHGQVSASPPGSTSAAPRTAGAADTAPHSAGMVSTTPHAASAPGVVPEQHDAHHAPGPVGLPDTTETVAGHGQGSLSGAPGQLGCHPASPEPSAPHGGLAAEMCSASAVPGPPVLPALAPSVCSVDAADDESPSGVGPTTAPIGERAPPTLPELQLLRI